jgi:hypothetical protein
MARLRRRTARSGCADIAGFAHTHRHRRRQLPSSPGSSRFLRYEAASRQSMPSATQGGDIGQQKTRRMKSGGVIAQHTLREGN